MKYTKGPWHTFEIITRDKIKIQTIATVETDTELTAALANEDELVDLTIAGVHACDEQAKADARLIAAAPELFDSVVMAEKLLDQVLTQIGGIVIDIGFLNDFFNTARSAIRKVEGEG